MYIRIATWIQIESSSRILCVELSLSSSISPFVCVCGPRQVQI